MTDQPTTYRIEFGPAWPVPPITVDFADRNAAARTVAEHAIPHLRPVLKEKGRPELADCFFQIDRDLTVGQFMWLSLAGEKAAQFCPARLTPHHHRGDPMTNQPTAQWTDIDPKDATSINLSERLDITAPLNENGERCPWPWEPQQLVGAPLGQYRCPYCMAMVMAGMPHLDYAPEERTLTRENADEVAEWVGGRRAGGAYELVAFDQFGETFYAKPGDVIHRDGYGEFTIRPATP